MPETEDGDVYEIGEEDDTPKKPTTKSKARTPDKSRTAAASPQSQRGGAITTGTADKRRRRNLERNRAAASKCRQRKKRWQEGLESKKIALESRYKALHIETKDLMEEVAILKNIVIAHAVCDDANIDDWIRNEADNFVRRMSGTQNAPVVSATPDSAAAGSESMAQMRSPTQGLLTATPAMTDTLKNMFAPIALKAPFDTTANNDLPLSAEDIISQDIDTSNPNFMMVSSMRT
ncbi:Transcription factor atf21 [Beauveria bassiana]|nr:Transcription factor atf21 [Beauveria bassiana]KAH8713430.1 Transcription factor atf21 [Beauveria bassiana]